MLSQPNQAGLDQRRFIVVGVVEKGPTLSQPRPQSSYQALRIRGGLVGPFVPPFRFRARLATRDGRDAGQNVPPEPVAPKHREQRYIVWDWLSVLDVIVRHATNTFSVADRIVKIGANYPEYRIGMLPLPEFDRNVSLGVGAKRALFHPGDRTFDRVRETGWRVDLTIDNR